GRGLLTYDQIAAHVRIAVAMPSPYARKDVPKRMTLAFIARNARATSGYGLLKARAFIQIAPITSMPMTNPATLNAGSFIGPATVARVRTKPIHSAGNESYWRLLHTSGNAGRVAS